MISWFSAGVSSAIATKIALNLYDDVKIIYIHIEDQLILFGSLIITFLLYLVGITS